MPQMSKSVLDASAILALLNDEEGADVVMNCLPEAMISAVNLAEVITRLVILGMPGDEVGETLGLLGLEVYPFDDAQAFEAGSLTTQTKVFGLSLGDRACLALARTLQVEAITADRIWSKLELDVPVRLIR